MDFLRRLLQSKAPLPSGEVLEAFPISFPNGSTPRAVRVAEDTDPDRIIHALQLSTPTPTIFLSGGAGMMDAISLTTTRSLVEDGLVRFLNDQRISLIDGGTTTGAMLLIGVARHRRSYTFPLIGVAPDQVVSYPGHDPATKLADLDGYHSHFILTAGADFGAESETIFNVAYALTGNGDRKRLVIVLNGGGIVKQEAYRCATREPRFPLLVMEGSGRFADELAESRKTGSDDPQIRAILDQGIVHFLPVKAGADNLYRWLENFFRTN